MKITEPYSPKPARERHGKAGQQRRNDAGENHLPESLPARGAQAHRRFLDLAVGILQHRLDGAHDERHADEQQRDQNAQRREGDFDAQRREISARSSLAAHRARSAQCPPPPSAARTADRPWHRRFFCRETVARQHPGQYQAEKTIDQRRRKEMPKLIL